MDLFVSGNNVESTSEDEDNDSEDEFEPQNNNDVTQGDDIKKKLIQHVRMILYDDDVDITDTQIYNILVQNDLNVEATANDIRDLPAAGEQLHITSEDPGASSRLLTDFELLDDDECGKEGGFGLVFICRHNLDKMIYAVKRIPFSYEGKIPMEVFALSSMDHPHIVKYHQSWTESYVKTKKTPPSSPGDAHDTSSQADDSKDIQTPTCNEADGCLFIQMQYCPKKLENLSKETAWKYFVQILEALDYMHNRGLCHCDISRANILLDSNNDARLIDFGLAQFLDPSMQDEDVVVLPFESLGLPHYRAPELLTSVSDKVDIYSLGMVAFMDLFSCFNSEMERALWIQDPELLKQVPLLLQDEDKEIQSLLFSMIDADADLRPSANAALKILSTRSGVTLGYGSSSPQVSQSAGHSSTASQYTSQMSTKDEERTSSERDSDEESTGGACVEREREG